MFDIYFRYLCSKFLRYLFYFMNQEMNLKFLIAVAIVLFLNKNVNMKLIIHLFLE
jgi:hypothetical protein